jgi:uncharacterized membrane protein YgdD (TMEM256/DUF423 family)
VPSALAVTSGLAQIGCMSPPTKVFCAPLLAAGFFGLTGVALGALGAHALAARLAERGMAPVWETAAKYQLVHAVALLAAGLWLHLADGATAGSVPLQWAARCWSLGILLFSGSLYWLACGGPRWLGPVTPLGGLALILGWGFIIAAAFTARK